MNKDILSSCFSFNNNVFITVLDAQKNIKKNIHKHNKCTRKMVSGILRYLCGHFTDTYNNETPNYETAKDYIPCYFNVGDGGVKKDGSGYVYLEPTIPDMESDWTTRVDYNSKKLVSEFTTEGSRSVIRVQDTSLLQDPVSDMDSIYFYCELSPGKLNSSRNVFVSELGLFANNVPKEEDLLAYVKLSNYSVVVDDEPVTKTDVLFVQPQDTILIRWIITIAAVGVDNRFEANFTDEMGQPIRQDINTSSTIGTRIITDMDNL